jgi:hypothetical protein
MRYPTFGVHQISYEALKEFNDGGVYLGGVARRSATIRDRPRSAIVVSAMTDANRPQSGVA